MPRGNPKQAVNLRLDPAVMAEVREYAGLRGFTVAVEEGLQLWLARAKRREAKATVPRARPAPRKAA
jgi:hypothetical protein